MASPADTAEDDQGFALYRVGVRIGAANRDTHLLRLGADQRLQAAHGKLPRRRTHHEHAGSVGVVVVGIEEDRVADAVLGRRGARVDQQERGRLDREPEAVEELSRERAGDVRGVLCRQVLDPKGHASVRADTTRIGGVDSDTRKAMQSLIA